MKKTDIDEIKKELRKELNAEIKKNLTKYLTHKDLQDILNKYYTKEEFDKRMIVQLAAFKAEMRYEFSLIEDTMSQFRNRLLTLIDPLLKEIETRREDREIGTAQIRDINLQLDTHDKRIAKLEHS